MQGILVPEALKPDVKRTIQHAMPSPKPAQKEAGMER